MLKLQKEIANGGFEPLANLEIKKPAPKPLGYAGHIKSFQAPKWLAKTIVVNCQMNVRFSCVTIFYNFWIRLI